MEVKHALSDKARRDLFLIERARKGDQKAFTELVTIYSPSLYHMVLKIVKHAEDAEDVTFSSIEKAFENLDKYTQEYAFSTWLYKIASNLSIDFLRKKKLDTVSLEQSTESDSGRPIDETRRAEQPDPEETYIRTQRADILKNAVDTLDEAAGFLVRLRYFEEYSYDEIAAKLNMPLGTVKVQLHRAKKILLARLTGNRKLY